MSLIFSMARFVSGDSLPLCTGCKLAITEASFFVDPDRRPWHFGCDEIRSVLDGQGTLVDWEKPGVYIDPFTETLFYEVELRPMTLQGTVLDWSEEDE